MEFKVEIDESLLSAATEKTSIKEPVSLLNAGFRALVRSVYTPSEKTSDEEVTKVSIDVQIDEALFRRARGRTSLEGETELCVAALEILLTAESEVGDDDAGPGMNSQAFGRFLITNELINLKQLREAVRLAKRMGARIGDLAVEREFLNRKQVEELNEQQRWGNRPFGELAIAAEMLSQAQVLELLEMQKKSRGGMGEALVQLEFISHDEMSKQFEAFTQAQIEADASGEMNDSENHLAKFIVDQFPEIARQIGGIEVGVQPTEDGSEREFETYTAGVCIRGESSVRLTLSVNDNFARIIMIGLFGPSYLEEVEMYPDAVGEFLNMLVGNTARSLEKEGLKVRGEAPGFDPPMPKLSKIYEFVATGHILPNQNTVNPLPPTATGLLFFSPAN